MRELLELFLKKMERLIREYGIKNGYASENKVPTLSFKHLPESGTGLYEGDVNAIKILVTSFNENVKVLADTNEAKYRSAALELISTIESLHLPGHENIRGLFTTTRYSGLQHECASISKICRDQYNAKKEEIDRLRQVEESKASATQVEAKAKKREDKRRKLEEAQRKHDEEQESKLRKMLEDIQGKSSADIQRIEAKYKAEAEAHAKELAETKAKLDDANETIINMSVRLQKGAALPGADTSAASIHLGTNSIFSTKTPEEKELNELQGRIGIIHARYVRSLATFSKLAEESELANKAKELLKQLLVNYETPIIVGTTESFKSVSLRNSANQDLFNKTLDEMALLEKNDSAEKHKKTIEDFHSTEEAKIVGKPLLTPQIQLLSKIKDFVMGYEKKPPSQMIGNIPSLNLALEERINAMKTERKKQQAQNAAPPAAAISKP